MSEVVELKTETFDELVLQAELPVVLDFWGPQCAPCKQLDPYVESLSIEMDGKVKFARVVAPENRKLCIDLKVMGLPSFLVFKDGIEIERLGVDATPEAIRTMVDQLLIDG